jgi:hypothetical protein
MEELEKEFVDYETTLELKELGFDEPCFAFFNGKHLSFARFDTLGNPLDICNCIEAPTYSQGFRFFREKYGLDSFCRQVSLSGRSYWKISRIEILEKIKGYSNFTNSYEEAELECLKRLIEIEKLLKIDDNGMD